MRLTDTEAFRTFIYAGDLKILYFLMILMIIDILTGLSKAIYNKNLWSRKALFGYSRKIFIFFIIILANIIDQLLILHGGLLFATIAFYIGNESLSILENCGAMGVKFPKEIMDKLMVLKSSNKSPKESLKDDFIDDPKSKIK